MARKKIEKAHWTPDDSLRALTGYQSDEDRHLRRERVVIELDDAGLRKLQHEATAVREKLAESRTKLAELKAAMKPLTDRERIIIEAMLSGTLDEYRDVYEYADEKAGLVYQYDPETKQKLGERELEAWERQHELDYDADDEGQESDDDAEGDDD